MAQQQIGIGAAPNDGLGDPLRTAFTKVNSNATDAETRLLLADTAIQPTDNISELTNDVGYITSVPLDPRVEPVPRTITASETLTSSDRVIFVDPTAGAVTITLPPVVNGVPITIVRVANGFNPVIISGEDINDGDASIILGLPSQKTCLLGDAARSTYRLMSPPPSAFGTLDRTTTDSHSVGSSYGIYDEWQTAVFSTPGRLIASISTDDISYIHNEVTLANPQIGFNIAFYIVFEDSASKNCGARLMFNPDSGSPIQLIETAVFGQGGGKVVSMSINDQVAIADTGTFYMEFKSEDPDTWTIFSAKLNVSRIIG